MARKGRRPGSTSTHQVLKWIQARSTQSTEGLLCWLWSGACDRQGYGKIVIAGKDLRAHRVVWTKLYGDIPEGLHVLHRCDMPGCIKPSHLMLGTQQMNVMHMDRRKRRNTPTLRNPNGGAVLTLHERQQIQERFAGGEAKKALAKRFGVSVSTIRRRLVKDAHLLHASPS